MIVIEVATPLFLSVVLLVLPGYFLLQRFFSRNFFSWGEKLILAFSFSVVADCLIILFFHYYLSLPINLLTLTLALTIVIGLKYITQWRKNWVNPKKMLR